MRRGRWRKIASGEGSPGDGAELISAGPLGFAGVLPSVRTVKELVERKLRET